MSRPQFNGIPLIGILRGCPDPALPHLVEAVLRGGMTHLEITMNTPGAGEQIREALRISNGKINIGAGTVTSIQLLETALSAGASFIVTPTLEREVVGRCVRLRVPVFSGAFSPTEILEAWELGAIMVKIFPAEQGGPSFVRALKGPFPSVQLLPTGGVDLASLPAFLAGGASGAGIGSPLFQKERIANREWGWIEHQAASFVRTYQNYMANRPSAQ